VIDMLRQILACGLLAALSVSAYADNKQEQTPVAPTNVGLEKMKKLVGTWVEADADGKPTDKVVSVIKLTAGGSAIHETLFPGQPQEMISIYTADGPDLAMTHYCMLGNQPRMKADAKSPANQLVFQFTGGGNLDPKKDKHMHAATLTIVDSDHIEIAGEAWDNGAPCKEMCCGMKLVRKE
jgi:hypothetical protein